MKKQATHKPAAAHQAAAKPSRKPIDMPRPPEKAAAAAVARAASPEAIRQELNGQMAEQAAARKTGMLDAHDAHDFTETEAAAARRIALEAGRRAFNLEAEFIEHRFSSKLIIAGVTAAFIWLLVLTVRSSIDRGLIAGAHQTADSAFTMARQAWDMRAVAPAPAVHPLTIKVDDAALAAKVARQGHELAETHRMAVCSYQALEQPCSR